VAISNDPREIHAELGRQREARPELRPVIELHRAVLAVQLDVAVPAPVTDLGPEQVREALEAGTPLLAPDSVAVPDDAFAALYDAICDVVVEHRPELADEVAALRGAPANGRRAADEGRPSSADPAGRSSLVVGQTEAVSDLHRFVLTNTWRPFLWPYAAALAPLVEDEQWYRERCPVCGGKPDLAALVKGGERWLLCSRCDTEWLYQRIGCPFCGNTDHRKLAYYTGDDTTYRLYVCEACRRYLKTVDQRERWQRLPLPVERVLTVGMDLAAVEAGYAGT
jgi:FdhE protein